LRNTRPWTLNDSVSHYKSPNHRGLTLTAGLPRYISSPPMWQKVCVLVAGLEPPRCTRATGKLREQTPHTQHHFYPLSAFLEDVL
ncbi:hypothetical protein GOODEAATRI_033464, partial [Goodea atripinnis]